MVKFCALMCGVLGLCVATTTSVFGGEFNYNKFSKLRKANDLAGMKAYVENNKVAENGSWTDKGFYVMSKISVEGKVNKTITSENIFQIADKFIEDVSGVTAAEKFAIKVRVYRVAWWLAGISQTNNDNICKQLAADPQSYSILNTYFHPDDVFHIFLKRNDFDKCVDQISKISPYLTFKYVVANKKDKQVIINAAKGFVESTNLNQLSSAQVLTILKNISKLTNPEYDEYVKQMLLVLNRVCYPKIQVDDQWKQTVVSIQLVMKSYGL